MAVRPSLADPVSDAGGVLAEAVQAYAANPNGPGKTALTAAVAAYNQAMANSNSNEISGGTFLNNLANYGGGIGADAGNPNFCCRPLAISDSVFSGNTAFVSGGAIYIERVATMADGIAPNTVIVDSTFTRNTVPNGYGGAIFNRGAVLGLTATVGKVTLFSGNTAGGKGSSVDFHVSLGDPDAVLSVEVGSGGMLDMRDPMGVESNTGGIDIGKIGAGIWALGGASDFTRSGSGKTVFGVAEGSLYLYADGEVENATAADAAATVAAGSIALAGSGSIFTLGGDTTLVAAGVNSITTEGTIVLGDGATLRGGTAADAADIDGGHALIATGGNTSLDLAADNGVLLDGLLNVAAFDAEDVFALNADLADKTGRTGSLSKTGAGAVVLNGVSTYAGMTVVEAGKLVVGDDGHAGASLAGAVTVRSGAILGGVGTIGSSVTIAEGAVHAPGYSIGEQRVLGDYVNNGVLRIRATSWEADRVVVAGSVDIGGASLDLALSPADAAGWNIFSGPFTIIEKQSDGAVAGTFSSIEQNLLFLDVLLDYQGGDGNDVTLTLERNDITFAGIGRTRNQIATGAAVESLGNASALWRSIALAEDQDTARAGFDALSGEMHAGMKTALIEDSRFVRNAMNDRIRSAFDGVGASHAPVMAYGPGGGAPVLVPPGHADPVFWTRGFGSWGTSDSDGNAADLDRSTGGLLIGADGSVGDWRVGLLAGYSHSRFDAKDRSSSGRSDNYHLGFYGGTERGNLAFVTGAAYAWHDIDTARAVAIPGIAEGLSAGYDAGTLQAFAELGYAIDMGGTRFEPFANLAYVGLHSAGFAERGGDAALRGEADNADATLGTLGLRAQHDISLGAVEATLRGMAGWRHAFGDVVPTSTYAFATGNAFTVAGVPAAKDVAVLEAGLDLDLAPRAMLGLSYTAQIAAGAQDHGFKADLTVGF